MILGFAGQIGSGKDEAARRVVELLPESGVMRISFADKLKKSAAAVFELDTSFWETAKRDDKIIVQIIGPGNSCSSPTTAYSTMTVRKMLQNYGTEGHRDIFGGSFWVDAALPMGLDHRDIVITVTDTRFPEEADRVKNLGGKIVRLRNGAMLAPEHDSEQILDDSLIDYEIDNSVRDDNFANLDRQLMDIFKQEGLLNDNRTTRRSNVLSK